jgi:hypothetical protein
MTRSAFAISGMAAFGLLMAAFFLGRMFGVEHGRGPAPLSDDLEGHAPPYRIEVEMKPPPRSGKGEEGCSRCACTDCKCQPCTCGKCEKK